jgi:lactoylglutathione lyase
LAAAQRLKSVGISLSRPRRDARGVDRNRGMWIEDPDGHRIEIMEMAPNCLQYEAIAAWKAGKPPVAVKTG